MLRVTAALHESLEMRQIPLVVRVVLGLCLALPLGLTFTALAEAAWGIGGSGTASALAYTMPSGNQPAVSTSESSVTVRWPAASFPDGQGVAGYVIYRFDAASGTQATVGASCSGTVTTTTCTELNVPAGNWIYTDTPVQDNWIGGASAPSTPVIVP